MSIINQIIFILLNNKLYKNYLTLYLIIYVQNYFKNLQQKNLFSMNILINCINFFVIYMFLFCTQIQKFIAKWNHHKIQKQWYCSNVVMNKFFMFYQYLSKHILNHDVQYFKKNWLIWKKIFKNEVNVLYNYVDYYLFNVV